MDSLFFCWIVTVNIAVSYALFTPHLERAEFGHLPKFDKKPTSNYINNNNNSNDIKNNNYDDGSNSDDDGDDNHHKEKKFDIMIILLWNNAFFRIHVSIKTIIHFMIYHNKWQVIKTKATILP